MAPKIHKTPTTLKRNSKSIRKQLVAFKRKSGKVEPGGVPLVNTTNSFQFQLGKSLPLYKAENRKEKEPGVGLQNEEKTKAVHKVNSETEKEHEIHRKVLNWLLTNKDIKIPATEEDLERELEKILLLKGISSGVQTLLSSKEFALLRRPEWRLTIDGNQFIVRGNKDKGDSFYRALAQAITDDENSNDTIREELCTYATQLCWSKYEAEIRREYRNQNTCPISMYAKPKELAKLYRHEQLKQKKPGSYFQLRVASDMYNFRFILVFKRRSAFTWVTFSKTKTNFNNNTNSNQSQKEVTTEEEWATDTRKVLIFLIWPKEPGRPLWKLLVALNSDQILDGDYPLFIKRTFAVHKCCFPKSISVDPHSSSELNQEFPNADFVYKVVTFEAGKEEFAFPYSNLSLPQDLYSLLSMIFFENVFHADEIQAEILEHRQRFGYFINLNPKRKHGGRERSSTLFSTHYRQDWGDGMDLKIAGSIYKFCYTLIAMDRLGNLSHVSECRDRNHVHEDNDNEVNFLALFTRILPTKIEWYKLEHFRSHRSGQEQFHSALEAMGEFKLRTIPRSAFSINMKDFSIVNYDQNESLY